MQRISWVYGEWGWAFSSYSYVSKTYLTSTILSEFSSYCFCENHIYTWYKFNRDPKLYYTLFIVLFYYTTSCIATQRLENATFVYHMCSKSTNENKQAGTIYSIMVNKVYVSNEVYETYNTPRGGEDTWSGLWSENVDVVCMRFPMMNQD